MDNGHGIDGLFYILSYLDLSYFGQLSRLMAITQNYKNIWRTLNRHSI